MHLNQNSKHDDDGSVGDPEIHHLSLNDSSTKPSSTLLLILMMIIRNMTGQVKIMVGIYASMIWSQVNLQNIYVVIVYVKDNIVSVVT